MRRFYSYWKNIVTAFGSLTEGLVITWRHILKARKSRKPLSITDPAYFFEPDGIATIQYPHAMLPVPVAGRYRLHNEIDDCIVCDKCAKICPVDCIKIEPIRATEEIGKTSDGTPKRIYAATFDINMAQCCFCGLCTTVCPTECLTMTKVYDFSVVDIREHTYAFAEMTPAAIMEKKGLWEEHQRSKTAQGANAPAPLPGGPARPRIKPPGSSTPPVQ